MITCRARQRPLLVLIALPALAGALLLAAAFSAPPQQPPPDEDQVFRSLHPETYWKRRADLLENLSRSNLADLEQIRKLALELRDALQAETPPPTVRPSQHAERIEKLAQRIQRRLKGG